VPLATGGQFLGEIASRLLSMFQLGGEAPFELGAELPLEGRLPALEELSGELSRELPDLRRGQQRAPGPIRRDQGGGGPWLRGGLLLDVTR
jgi:hypothetical protein